MRLWAASVYVWTPAWMAKKVYGDQCGQLFSLHFKRRSVVGAAALRQASRRDQRLTRQPRHKRTRQTMNIKRARRGTEAGRKGEEGAQAPSEGWKMWTKGKKTAGVRCFQRSSAPDGARPGWGGQVGSGDGAAHAEPPVPPPDVEETTLAHICPQRPQRVGTPPAGCCCPPDLNL